MSTMTLEELVAIEGYAAEYGDVTDKMLTKLIDFANAHLAAHPAEQPRGDVATMREALQQIAERHSEKSVDGQIARTALAAQPKPEQAAVSRDPFCALARGIKDCMGDGQWRPCSGCYDTEDGHPTQRYMHSNVLGCDIGIGCSECGGMGVVWQDFSQYETTSDDEPEQAVGDGVDGETTVRYCPECSHLGEVHSDCRDCCPDGSKARYIPQHIAEAAQRDFRASIAPSPAVATAGDGVTDECGSCAGMGKVCIHTGEWEACGSCDGTGKTDTIASRPVEAVATPAEFTDFDTWYTQNVFDYQANPLGSRDCALQRKAWNAALAHPRYTGERAGGPFPIHAEANDYIARGWEYQGHPMDAKSKWFLIDFVNNLPSLYTSQPRPVEAAQGGVAEGYKVVPLNLTDEMKNAYQEELCHWFNVTRTDDAATEALWSALLAAAPEVPR